MSEKRKHTFLLGMLLATSLPFFFAVKQPVSVGLSGNGLKALLLYLSDVAGYVGLSLLMWQFILGTRSVAALFFADLASKLKLHKDLGTYGSVVFLLHPVLLILAYHEPWKYLIWPTLDGGYETAVTFGRLAFIGLLIIWVTSALLRGNIRYRPWKYIHYLSYPILLVALLHIPHTGDSFQQPAIKFFWVSFVSVILLCTALRMRHLFGYGKVPYEVLENSLLNERVYLLKLRAEHKKIGVSAGQYVYLQPGLRHEEHPFSVPEYDNETGELLIAYKVFGAFTRKLSKMLAGETLLVDGSYGVFTRELNDVPPPGSVFIAGGIGMTPFFRHAFRRKDARYVLFYANQTVQSAVLRNQLKQHLGERYIDVFSREQPGSLSDTNIEYGYVNVTVIAKYVQDLASRQYYICGPQGLIDDLKKELLEAGVPHANIHAEEFAF